MGPINPDAKQEYDKESERYEFMKTSRSKICARPKSDLKQVIAELDELTKTGILAHVRCGG